MLYPLTGDSYPTVIKATGTGEDSFLVVFAPEAGRCRAAISGTVGRICTILVAPVCTRLQIVAPLLPYQCFLGITLVAFFASLLL